MEDLILHVDNVSKQYKLGQIGGTTLRDELQRWSAKRRGKEDPTKKIDAKDYTPGETFMALDGVSFDVKRGERVGIIGHNGAGKSTLLKLISRVTAPTSGTIGLNGRVASMLEVGTGFHPELTGRENIYMNGAILGMTRREIDAKMEDIIEFSECRQFIDTPVKRYSSGMYVKLAFSVAAHLDSEIMIMDEVLAVGDMAFQKKCLGKMSDVSKTQCRTILYVSHNMNTIRQLCNRVLVLKRGIVYYDGTVEEGIATYLDSEITSDITIDYNSVPRLKWLTNTSIRTLRVRFINKANNVFKNDENMVIELMWVDEKEYEDLCLRIEMLRIDRSPIGTALLENICSGCAGREHVIRIRVNISILATGQYTMNYSFYFVDSFGNNVGADCVHGLYFDVIANENISWNNKSWGDIHFPRAFYRN